MHGDFFLESTTIMITISVYNPMFSSNKPFVAISVKEHAVHMLECYKKKKDPLWSMDDIITTSFAMFGPAQTHLFRFPSSKK